MKGLITLVLLFLSSVALAEDQYIDVKIDSGWFGSGDGCAESTKIKKAKGKNKGRCKYSTKYQSDGYCAESGDKIVWKASKAISIVKYGSVFSGCDDNGTKRVTCTVAGGIANDAYKYAIETNYKDGGKCILDPRIIVNNNH